MIPSATMTPTSTGSPTPTLTPTATIEVDHGLFLSANQYDIYSGSQLDIAYILPYACDLQLKVYNVRGRVIKILHEGNGSKGRHMTSWDGTDDMGQRVNSGLYLVTLRYNDFTVIKKVVAIRH